MSEPVAPKPDESPPGVRAAPATGPRILAWVLIAAGALIALTCGGCSLAFAIAALSTPPPGTHADTSGMLVAFAVIGFVPAVFGAAMVYAGMVLLRSRK
ncbi:MAG TPA: hypothetical protein VIB82_08090 [Caulobacteraceae bacterium]